jgi:hypothetical protein
MAGRHRLPPNASMKTEAHRKYLREYKRKHRIDPDERDSMNRQCWVYAKQRRAKLKEELFAVYGSICACCGETEKRFLTLEHKNGSDLSESNFNRKRTIGVEKVWKEAINAKDPTRYEILCYNCNIGKKNNKGICPHKDDVR